MLIQFHREANERSAPFVDHAGVLRDSKTGRSINGYISDDMEDDGEDSIGLREFFSVLDLCSVAENFVLQRAIPSSTVPMLGCLVKGSVTSSPTSAK